MCNILLGNVLCVKVESTDKEGSRKYGFAHL